MRQITFYLTEQDIDLKRLGEQVNGTGDGVSCTYTMVGGHDDKRHPLDKVPLLLYT